MDQQLSEQSDSQWIVTTSTHVDCEGHTAMVVQAGTQEEAAAIGADWFTEHSDYADALPITHVFVALWAGRTAYVIRSAAEVAELQCCGGGPHAAFVDRGGHFGGCRQAPEREECSS